MSVNINREVQDEFYRYKMPKMNAKVEGKGNGRKTILPNMTEVAKALKVPPAYPTKFFGCELGSMAIIDDKKDRYGINGEHGVEDLRNLLDKYIKKYVLCYRCEYPELVTRIKKSNKQYVGTCGACGWSGPLDNAHKLITYVMKNPPNSMALGINQKEKITTTSSSTTSKERTEKPKSGKAKNKDQQKDTLKVKGVRGSKGDGCNSQDVSNVASDNDYNNDDEVSNNDFENDNDNDDEEDNDEDNEDNEGMKFNMKEKDLTVTADNNDSDAHEDDWEVDIAQVKGDLSKGMSAAVQAMLVNEESELPESERLLMFAKTYRDSTKTINEVYEASEKLDVNDAGLMQMVIEKLQEGSDSGTETCTFSIPQNISKYDKLFLRFCINNEDNQKVVLGATEQLISKILPKMMDKMAAILHMYYEKDILDEEVIIAWSHQSKSVYTENNLLFKKILKHSEKFIEWLENAESESDDDSDDGDGIAFSKNKQTNGVTATTITQETESSETAETNNKSNSNNNVTSSRGTGSKYGITVAQPKAPVKYDDDDSDIDLDNI